MATSFFGGEQKPLLLSGDHLEIFLNAVELKRFDATNPRRPVSQIVHFASVPSKSMQVTISSDTDFAGETVLDFILAFSLADYEVQGSPEYYQLSYSVGVDLAATVDWRVSAGLYFPFRNDLDPIAERVDAAAYTTAGYASTVFKLGQIGNVYRRLRSSSTVANVSQAYIGAISTGGPAGVRSISDTRHALAGDHYLDAVGTIGFSPSASASLGLGSSLMADVDYKILPWIGLCIRLSSLAGEAGAHDDVIYGGSHVRLAGTLWDRRYDLYDPLG